jgi:hypothetical protein
MDAPGVGGELAAGTLCPWLRSWVAAASRAPAVRWLAGTSDPDVWSGSVRGLLLGVGGLSSTSRCYAESRRGSRWGPSSRGLVAAVAGVASASSGGVAGGELIIPTLLFALGVHVKTAGIASPLISIPTILAGLWRPGERSPLREDGEVAALVVR